MNVTSDTECRMRLWLSIDSVDSRYLHLHDNGAETGDYRDIHCFASQLSAPKHGLWVLVGTTPIRLVQRVPIVYVLEQK